MEGIQPNQQPEVEELMAREKGPSAGLTLKGVPGLDSGGAAIHEGVGLKAECFPRQGAAEDHGRPVLSLSEQGRRMGCPEGCLEGELRSPVGG